MSEGSKNEIDLFDLLKVLKLNRYIILIFFLIIFLSIIAYYYFYNKKYDLIFKYFPIDNINFEKHEILSDEFQVLPKDIKDFFIFNLKWDYTKFKNLILLYTERTDFLYNTLNDLSIEDQTKALDIISNLKFEEMNDHLKIRAITKYPEYFISFFSLYSNKLNEEFTKKLINNLQHTINMKDAFIENQKRTLDENKQLIVESFRKKIEIKILILKKQLQNDINEISKYDGVLYSFFEILFPSYILDNLSEDQINLQINYYEKILENNLFLVDEFEKILDNTVYLCEDCDSKIAQEFFSEINIEKLTRDLNEFRIGHVNELHLQYEFIHPWKFNILVKYILFPFILFYLILLFRYVYFQKHNVNN